MTHAGFLERGATSRRRLGARLAVLALSVAVIAGCTADPLPTPSPSATEVVPVPPVLVPASADLAAQYLDPQPGPALVTGAMPATADYSGGVEACSTELPDACDHPPAPPLTPEVLATADETWAVVLYAQAPLVPSLGRTGGSNWVNTPAGMYLVNAEGAAYFVAAGNPAEGPLGTPWGVSLAWAPGRAAAVAGLLESRGPGEGGFTLIDLLSGASTTVYAACEPVQAVARSDGWLLRADCDGDSVAAVVSDTGEIVTTDGLLVADHGEAANVGDDYLVFVPDPVTQLPTSFYAIIDGASTLIRGDSCELEDTGRSVACRTGLEATVVTLGPDGVTNRYRSPAVGGLGTFGLCSVGDVIVRSEQLFDTGPYSMTIEPGSIPVEPDTVSGSQLPLTCTPVGGGIAYLDGYGGVWAFDSSTSKTTPVLSAPDEVVPWDDKEWPYEGLRVVSAMVSVGGPSFLNLGW